VDLTESPAEQAFRAEARAWLEANVPRAPLPSGDTRVGFAAHLEWERALFGARWSVVSWPERYGGRDASLWEWLIFEEEYYRAGAPQRVPQNGIFLLAPSLFEFGTPEQQDRILPDAATAVARAAIQCHGAIAYTTEYDLHLFAKRAWALAPSWGSAGWHRRRLARALGLDKEKEG
jgi:alkylation response protein AidB-like acyl-CoA dehydrogenase